jgi:CSLREA domain-containing protein
MTRSRLTRYRPVLDCLESRLAPATFFVNTLADTVDADADVTSLREALLAANANPGGDTINFSVAGQINVATQLPTISDATGNLFLDGNSAPSYAGTPVVSLFGPGTGSGVSGLQIEGSINNLVRGLQIGNFANGIDIRNVGANANAVVGCYIGTDGSVAVPNGTGVFIFNGAASNRIGTNGDGVNDAAEGNLISGNLGNGIDLFAAGDNTVIAGNRVGTNSAGTAALANGGVGISVGFTKFARVGTNSDGTSDDLERNLISGNALWGVAIGGAGARNNDVLGNFIGTDVTGTAAIPNGEAGVLLSDTFNNRIGDFSTAGRNVISGNLKEGILVTTASPLNLVNRNAIGTDLSGTLDLGNGSHGIMLTNGGGTLQVAQNTIAFNGGDGVHMTSTAGTGVQITSTSFFDNGGLGINLVSATDDATGVTLNDFLDADSGPNNLQNAPVITKAIATGAGTAISYKLHGTPNTLFLVQFFRSPAADPSGFGEGRTQIAQRGLTTDASGNAGETFTTGVIGLGQAITAIASGSSTSEFSNAVPVSKQLTFTGAVSASWSDPANWGGVLPAAGDHLVFGPGSPSTMVNDFPVDTQFSSLSFSGGDYAIAGNRVRLGDGGISVAAGSAVLALDFHIDPICPPIGVELGSQLTLSGILSGPGGMHKEGLGTAILSGANTYAGETHIEEGLLRITHGAALGTTAGRTEVGVDGTLELSGGITVAGETLSVVAAERTADIIAILIGHNIWGGAIELPSHFDPICLPISTAAGTSLTVSGVISGGSLTDLAKTGAGTLILDAANTYAGKTEIMEGALRITNAAALGTSAGSTEITNRGVLELDGDFTVAGESLNVEDLNQTDGIIAILIGLRSPTWAGPINLPQHLDPICPPISAPADSTLTISGVISGGSGAELLKLGAGTLILNAANTYLAKTEVMEGTLLVNGSIVSDHVEVVGGVLGGAGIITQTQVLSGSLRPGNSPGLLTVDGDVTFTAGTSFDVELNGTVAGSQYDQLAVQGSVNLGGATLNASVGYASNVGDRFVIISNDGSDAVNGTFAGLAEGATLALGGSSYRITYVGGDGNDVELIRLGVGVVDGSLIVDGTSADDKIRIVVRGDDDCDDDDPARVTVRVNGEVAGRFALSSFQQIVVHGLAGDDHIRISDRIEKPAFLYGDAGDDRLKGGRGNDVLLGGDGDDHLHGHHGRDLLIGGRGGDRIIGEHDDDLLIAAFTSFDNDASALSAIMAEWTRTDQNYDQRVSHLRDGGGNNGSVVLVAEGSGATVFDDGVEDRLTGNQGRDWFFANLSGSGVLDKITDWNENEDGDDFDP